jgi:hypothetical protein
MREFRVLSLGAGVQSSTLLRLSIRGVLPRLDAAIFGDTQYEPAAVYAHLARLEAEAAAAGIPLYRVTRGSIRHDALTAQRVGQRTGGRNFGSMPFFVDPKDGSDRGMVRRQCTKEYKLRPIRAKLRELVGLKPGERVGDKVRVEQWVGFSADELHRVRQSRDYWIALRYPLIFDLTPAWRRQDCLAWLAREYPEPVPRSACISCPFHSNAEWRALRDGDPASWAEAVAFDAAMRKLHGMRGDVYLHSSLRPLDEAPIDTDDPRQGSLFSCGVCAT